MNLRKFFVGRAIGFIIFIIVGLSFWGYKTYFSDNSNTVAPVPSTKDSTEPPTFTWKYEKADSLNLDGLPNTNISLEVKYQDDTTQTKLIDTSGGGCNDLPDRESDSALNSTVAQCYGAGLGYRFKVVKGENAYQVERIKFEEALPDYTPPAYKYEVVAEFPLTN
jgi:hypothetical protein